MVRWVALIMTVGVLSYWILDPSGEWGLRRTMTSDVRHARQLAEVMLVQQQALYTWAKANGGVMGAVPAASLQLPAPWSTPADVFSYVGMTGAGPVAVTYYSGRRFPPGAVVGAIAEVQHYPGTIGMAGSNFLLSPAGQTTPLPAGIPQGFAAVAEVVE